MFHIFETIQNFLISQDRSNSCDDFVDRLNRKYTVILLVIFVTVLNSKQYIGEPLSCFCPAHFTGAHVEYTNNICMISRSFYISMDRSYLRPQMQQKMRATGTSTQTPMGRSTSSSTTTKSSKLSILLNFGAAAFGDAAAAASLLDETRGGGLNSPLINMTSQSMNYLRVENLIAYYPFFLMGQAILFYIPFFFWKNFLNRTAYDLRTLIFIANQTQGMSNPYDRERSLRYLIGHVERAYDYYNSKATTLMSSVKPRKAEDVWAIMHRCVDFTLNPLRKCSADLDEIYSYHAQSIKSSSSSSSAAATATRTRARTHIQTAAAAEGGGPPPPIIESVSLSSSTTIATAPSSSSSSSSANTAASWSSSSPSSSSPSFYTSVLFRVYLLKKLVYILNALAQFCVLSKFVAGQTKSNIVYNAKSSDETALRRDLTYLADNSLMLGLEFGYNAVSSLIRTGNLFEESSMLLVFHTVVFCDFQIHMLGDRLQRYTIQCVVPINVYIEKMFTILWFWFLFLTCINIYTFIKWLCFYFSLEARLNFAYSNSLNINTMSLMTASAAATTSSHHKHQHHHNNHHHHYHHKSSPKHRKHLVLASEATTSNSSSNKHHRVGPNVDEDDYYTKVYRLYFTSTGVSHGRAANERLVRSYLMHDRMFILKIIAENTNEIIARELVTLSVETLNKRSFNENTV